ncbi:hypothetical protein Tco_0811271 [Tanacetum coccineum]
MSDSTGGMTDLDDIDDMEMIMQQLQYEQSLQEQESERSNRRNYIYRGHDVAEECLMALYFGDHPKYPAYYFRKRYRMSRKLFLDIVAGQSSFSVIMKCTSNIRRLLYGITPDALDEYLQMGDHCARGCLDYFTM